jgi:tRNA pseudouridine32 synthase/23S rRNA pseudouridine746 synthase
MQREKLKLADWRRSLIHPLAATFPLPEQFTFPFHYEPHPLARLAADELQAYLKIQQEWQHDFGFDPPFDSHTSGKMFGVLVVEQENGEIAYLAAFSGKLAGDVHQPGFVPPVFDMLEPDGFFRLGEEELNVINRQIEEIEHSEAYQDAKNNLNAVEQMASLDLLEAKQRFKNAKQARANLRKLLESSGDEDLLRRESERLNQESRAHQFAYKDLARHWKERRTDAQNPLIQMEGELLELKQKRKAISNALQEKLFEEYLFLNKDGQFRSLRSIFGDLIPPAGAGDCAAPKLLQFAFRNGLRPVCMAEFWWGKSPETEVRVHQQFYPACRGKCKPILGHMLEGISIEPNSIFSSEEDVPQIEIIHEDDELIVVFKPERLLSVPGLTKHSSVLVQMKALRPDIEGPVIVHRLDLSTSGIMLIPKTMRAYIAIQKQFIDRSIEKRYEALLEGSLELDRGLIDLPIRVDLNDRPRQMVCYEYGKQAITKWEKIEEVGGITRVYFYPQTGRTHQLRVHSAHKLGLNAPILGDDLYGNKSTRMMLHAGWIRFNHPSTCERVEFNVPAPF